MVNPFGLPDFLHGIPEMHRQAFATTSGFFWWDRNVLVVGRYVTPFD